MSEAVTTEEILGDTIKAVRLRHLKDGTHVILTEEPADGEHHDAGRDYDLGQFNETTAKSVQSYLQFRFAHPGQPLTTDEIGKLKNDVRSSGVLSLCTK